MKLFTNRSPGIVLLCLLGLWAPVKAQSYDTLRVMTYNLLNYPGSDSDTRNLEFRKTLRAVNPDLLVVQEMTSAAGVTNFLNNVLNYGQAGTYAAAPFSDGPDTDNSMFYKVSEFSFIGPQTVLSTALRDINGYRLRPAGISADSLDIQIYSAHLKASTGFETERGAEAEIWRTHLNSLPDGGFFIGCGDWNLYNSATEPAWTNLTGSRTDNSGRLYDPINSPGNWHDNATFEGIHTQSPRVEQFGGGATGGMDDRFDFALLSYNFQNLPGWQYVTDSYLAYGNDGNHLNLSINAGTNTAVPDSIADALYYGSDHLPVILKIRRQITSAATIALLAPNGGETWYTGNSQNITWSSSGLTGTVTLKLNRSYPAGAWETLFAGTPNDGSQAWTVSGNTGANMRVQVVSDAQPAVNDVSNADFSIQPATITLTRPNGGESFMVCHAETLRWSSVGVAGNVRIELNRSYPSGGWETLYGSAINDGMEVWTVTSPAAAAARLRIIGVSNAVGDTSATNFTIIPSTLPTLVHEPHADGGPGSLTFTAHVYDDCAGVTTKLFYGLRGSFNYDSVAMAATGNPGEVSCAITVAAGCWGYFVRSTDASAQVTQTDSLTFAVGTATGVTLAYDDGTAETYNWVPVAGTAWAVRFTPPGLPYVLNAADVTVAGFHPDSTHYPFLLRVMAPDGPGGLPGTVLWEQARGSVGNVIGGLTVPGGYMVTSQLRDAACEPLVMTGDFYLAVENIAPGMEAFGIDTSSVNASRSFVFDACNGNWFPENGVNANSRNGNRLIRAHGWVEQVGTVVIYPNGNDIQLRWTATGAPFYRIYKTLDLQSGISTADRVDRRHDADTGQRTDRPDAGLLFCNLLFPPLTHYPGRWYNRQAICRLQVRTDASGSGMFLLREGWKFRKFRTRVKFTCEATHAFRPTRDNNCCGLTFATFWG